MFGVLEIEDNKDWRWMVRNGNVGERIFEWVIFMGNVVRKQMGGSRRCLEIARM